MKQLPKVSKVSLDELDSKSGSGTVMTGVIAVMLAGVSFQAGASTDAAAVQAVTPSIVAAKSTERNTSAVILNKPALEGAAFAAHYSHSSHASHSSHYSCTPGKTC
ncbi:TPA: hypothetical protein JD854_RS17490 [Citrobacter amalonaticus]|uniref:Uncharacterized protein n=1 Tax=Citrobacter amalonaticus TaxID=35703 RepID=A0A9C7QNY7_CITAM|nr:hypothetical protein [Citrobacter amalonaticus]